MKSDSFLIYGTDKKMMSCCQRLKSFGFEADMINNENTNCIGEYGNIILPLPTIANSKINGTDKTLFEFIAALNSQQKVFCGNIDARKYNNFYSYYNAAFLIKNSRLTAQGVLRMISINIEVDFKDLSVAVIGYGRCGKAICKLLKNCSMNITSFSRRNESIVLARNDGMIADDLFNLNHNISDFDIIINTVPVNIIDRECLAKLSQRNIYIEIASKPYGFNVSESDVFNFKYILAESLPGRFTPVSAGYNIADTVLDIIKEGDNG